MVQNTICRQCRRAGKKLFLKGEKCNLPSCPFIKKSYAPGEHSGKMKKLTPYGIRLLEKQSLKRIYGLREKQFKNYVKKAIKSKINSEEALCQFLETRLDNVVFKLGFGDSLKTARQLVNHGHILVNGKKVDIPFFQVKVGNVIELHPKIKEKFLKEKESKLKKYKTPLWLSLDIKTLKGKIVSFPKPEEVFLDINIPLIIEFYSR